MSGEQPQSRLNPLSHQEAAELFPVYIAEAVRGGAPESRYPLLAAHLAGCPACRTDLDELLELAHATLLDQDELPPAYPTPNLSALAASAPRPAEPQTHWRIDDLGRWILALTEELLALGRPSLLVGLNRADNLLYDLTVAREGDQAPELRLEVFERQAGSELYLRFSLDLPELDPLDMAGVAITARGSGGEVWHAVTDSVGAASLSGIPRPALVGLSIGITAGRSA
jgi:hypothetical protein